MKASNKDLQKEFDKMSKSEIIVEILKKGVLQVSELERDHDKSKMRMDIANKICKMTVNKET